MTKTNAKLDSPKWMRLLVPNVFLDAENAELSVLLNASNVLLMHSKISLMIVKAVQVAVWFVFLKQTALFVLTVIV